MNKAGTVSLSGKGVSRGGQGSRAGGAAGATGATGTGAASVGALEEETAGVGALLRAWEPLRTARLFTAWALEASLLYVAIWVMLW